MYARECVHSCSVYLCVRVCVCHLILRGSRQPASQPEHDPESETTRQGTKCVTWAQSFSLSLKTVRPREGGIWGSEREKERERQIEREASTNPLHSEAN